MNESGKQLLNIRIDKNSPIPIYYQAYLQIIELINKKVLKEGGQLPTEFELAEHLNINRMTARQIYKTLDGKGYLYRVAGKGTFLKNSEERNKYKELKKTGNIAFYIFLKELDPFFARVLKGIEQVLTRNNYNIILKLANDDEEKAIADIINKKSIIDGIICAFYDYDKAYTLIEKINKAKIPLVILEGYLDNMHNDFVGIDFAHYNYKLTKYLINKGRKKILFYNIGHKYYANYMNGIYASFKKAVEESGLDLSQCIVVNEILGTKEGLDFENDVDNIIKLKGKFDSIILNTIYAYPIAYIELVNKKAPGLLTDIDIGVILSEVCNPEDYDDFPVVSSLKRRDFFLGKVTGKRILHRIENNTNLKPSIMLIRENSVKERLCSYQIKKNKILT